MKLEDELRQLFERTDGAPWPGEREAFDRFLHRRARRGRAVAAAAGLALVAPGCGDTGGPPTAPGPGDRRAGRGVGAGPEEGFQLTVPAGWRVDNELTGTVSGRSPVGPQAW